MSKRDIDYVDVIGPFIKVGRDSLENRKGLPNNECGLRAFNLWLLGQYLMDSRRRCVGDAVAGFKTVQHEHFNSVLLQDMTGWGKMTVWRAISMLKEHDLIQSHPQGPIATWSFRVEDTPKRGWIPVPQALAGDPQFFGSDIAGARAMYLAVRVMVPTGINQVQRGYHYFFSPKHAWCEKVGWSQKQLAPALERCIRSHIVGVVRGHEGTANQYSIQHYKSWVSAHDLDMLDAPTLDLDALSAPVQDAATIFDDLEPPGGTIGRIWAAELEELEGQAVPSREAGM